MIFFNEAYVVSLFVSSFLFWTVIRESHRTKFIVLASFIALAFIQLEFTLFLVFLVLFVFWGSRVMERSSDYRARWFLALLIILIVVMLSFKHMGGLFALIFSEENAFSQKYIVPLGISYLSFKLIAYVLDVYRGHIENPTVEDLLAFMLFLPIFPAGPIERFQNFAGKRRTGFDRQFYIEGLRRLAIGYFKKVVIVNLVLHYVVVKVLYARVDAGGVSLELSAATVLAFLVGALLYAFFDLAAYADIAIGYGHLFGYKIIENMRQPLFQRNLSDYWGHWHISLSQWCRNNVYFPILGKYRKTTLALYCSFIVMGLWHNVSLNWILWGMWHATGITIYQRWDLFKRKHKRLKNLLPARVDYVVGVVITILYSGLGFTFIMMDTTPKALRVLLAIFM